LCAIERSAGAALRVYERPHAPALAVLTPGGLYAAASCTSQIDVETFRRSITQAAIQYGGRFRS
jgi:23S rRNA G2069 N7-methylase RlmK/C1962 C5-methylase RlmI